MPAAHRDGFRWRVCVLCGAPWMSNVKPDPQPPGPQRTINRVCPDCIGTLPTADWPLTR